MALPVLVPDFQPKMVESSSHKFFSENAPPVIQIVEKKMNKRLKNDFTLKMLLRSPNRLHQTGAPLAPARCSMSSNKRNCFATFSEKKTNNQNTNKQDAMFFLWSLDGYGWITFDVGRGSDRGVAVVPEFLVVVQVVCCCWVVGAWCLSVWVFGVWCLVFWCFGVWCLVFGVWVFGCLVFGVWVFGAWCLGAWCLVLGVWVNGDGDGWW